MIFYKHELSGNIFIATNQPEIQPNEKEYIELKTNNHYLITSHLLKQVTFQEAFSDEIESISRQYKDSLAQRDSVNVDLSNKIIDLKKQLQEEKRIHALDVDKMHDKEIHFEEKLNEAHEANSKLKADLNYATTELLRQQREKKQLEQKLYKLEQYHQDTIQARCNESNDIQDEYESIMNNDEYALKSKVESLTKANDKLADLAIKFYLKSEGIEL